MHRFLPDLIILVIVEIALFSVFIDILATIPYEPMFISGILIVFLLLIVLVMVIIYRGIDRLWKHIYKGKGS
ncbi:MAG: hypothetical protein M1285_05505 [Candidatus Thermoplasmatota archaeon]|nr:hypothetical protein [Candidatus Thermoplasmatota archaeon]